MPTYLTPQRLSRDLSIRDLTDPTTGPHAIQMLVDEAVNALQSAWGCAVRRCSGPALVDTADNYDNLGFTADAASRDARYTRYVNNRQMLRSHSSAMIPPALRALAAEPAGPVLLVCPGMVYRRDSIDRLHTGTPHQLDLWLVAPADCELPGLDEMTELLIGALAPGRPWRAEERIHPYTTDGRQVDVEVGEEWIEVWECGLAHPDVLARAGLQRWHGLALGLGLDRFLMLRMEIPDIRLIRSSDPRVSAQMLNLEPYRAVSSLPAIVRDLSVAVDADDDVEALGDRVRDALGPDAEAVEEVSVVSTTECAELPASAVLRMGMREGQKNLLVRVVLRPVAQTLTDPEANDLRDRVYAAIHQGAATEWAVAARP